MAGRAWTLPAAWPVGGRGIGIRRVSGRLGARRAPPSAGRLCAGGDRRQGDGACRAAAGDTGRVGARPHHKPQPVCTTNQNQGYPAPCLVLCAMRRKPESVAHPRTRAPMFLPPFRPAKHNPPARFLVRKGRVGRRPPRFLSSRALLASNAGIRWGEFLSGPIRGVTTTKGRMQFRGKKAPGPGIVQARERQ